MPPDDGDYALRWRMIKSQFSRNFSTQAQRSSSKVKHREKGIWQRRYWEHQIRDYIDLQRHVDYIHYNPVKHGLVNYVKDWLHSTFHRYVKQGTCAENCGVRLMKKGYLVNDLDKGCANNKHLHTLQKLCRVCKMIYIAHQQSANIKILKEK